MSQKCHGVDQIIPMLRRADVELGKGKKVPEVCKRLGITQQTYYRWRQKYGGMAPEMAKELKALQKENTRLKKLVADQVLDNAILKGSREGKLLSPERRRLTVAEVRRRLGPETVSERRACRVLGQPRTTQRYQPQRPAGRAEAPGRDAKHLPSSSKVRQSPRASHVASYRLVRQSQANRANLAGRKHASPKKTAPSPTVAQLWQREQLRPSTCPAQKDHVWSYDFVTDRTEDRRQIRLLVVIDEFTRECLAIEVARSFTARQVVEVLRYLFAVRGTPQFIRSRPTLRVGARGPEFVAKEVRKWLGQADVQTLFIAPGKPLGERLRGELQRQAA